MIEHTIPVLTISETKAKRALQLSVVDQENAQKIIEQQQKLSTDSHTYFRPYRYAKSDKDGQIDDEDIQTDNKDDQKDDQLEQTLLWVQLVGASGTMAAAATTSIWQHHVLDGCSLQDDT